MDYDATARLVERAKKGDYEAFAQIYKELSKPIYYLALRIIQNEEDAKDVLQETMVILFKNLYSIKNSQAVVAYVNQVAYNQCMRILRKKNPLGPENDDEFNIQSISDSDVEFIPEEYVDKQERRAYIVGLIDELSESLKFVIMLYYYNGLSISQIAETLKVSEGAVKTRLSRARATLKKKLESDKKGFARCIVPTPILSQILQANADEVFTVEVSDAIWQSLSVKLGYPAEAIALKDTALKGTAPVAPAAYWVIPAVVVVTCATVIGAGVLLHQRIMEQHNQYNGSIAPGYYASYDIGLYARGSQDKGTFPDLYVSAAITENVPPTSLLAQQPARSESNTSVLSCEYLGSYHTQRDPIATLEDEDPTVPCIQNMLQIIAIRPELQYPEGSLVTAQQVLSDAGITALDEHGGVAAVEIIIAYLEKVDFDTPNTYAVYAQAIDGGGSILTQIVILIEVTG